MEIAEPAEEWLTSAQAMSLARRTGTDRVMPWEQLGQSGIATPVMERSPVTIPPIMQPRRRMPKPVYPRRNGRGTYRGSRAGFRRPAGHWQADMSPRLAAARAAARAAVPATTVELQRLVRIPSISGSAAHRGDVIQAVEWLATWLRRRTRSVHLVPTRAGPVVLARVIGRERGRPTVLLYGHLDVRPAGAGWTRSPFYGVVQGSRLVARGASDDKGQLMAQLAALDALISVGGPPGDVIVVVEAAEEIGSPTLAEVLRRWRDHAVVRGPVVAVVISDTRAARPGVPSLTTSQRGLLALRLSVDVSAVGPRMPGDSAAPCSTRHSCSPMRCSAYAGPPEPGASLLPGN